MLKDGSLTYISLFSCAGVGCYGFKEEGFKCIATNEIVERRLEVQKFNNKCELESGYISGDISTTTVKNQIYKEIKTWKKKGNDRVDVVVATPPCQGISVINHKKNANDIERNSLVVESVEIIKNIKPRFFVFENVMAFQKTLCITPDEKIVSIGDYIRGELGEQYIISGRIMNFMNYGSNSSRTRTLMIGVDKSFKNNIVPMDIYPKYCHEKSLRDIIYNFPRLAWGEIDEDDFYHAFRTYDLRMRAWIHDLKEGESAFDNDEPEKRPHRIVNGQIVENKRKNRDKYTRQPWDRFIQCVHTRNDQLAAQNTIHPEQDRVYSIRELMEMMTIPRSFKWMPYNIEELNALSDEEKRKLYKQHEVNIRQCIGEAVPTEIMRQVAHNIKESLSKKRCDATETNKIICKYKLEERKKLLQFLKNNPLDLDIASLCRITELCNARREKDAAFYTNKFLINEIMGWLPTISKDEIYILEPSVGAGGFIPFLFKRYEDVPKVHLDVIDINQENIQNLKILLEHIDIPSNFEINVICEDFLLYDAPYRYDLAVGNPPFSKLKKKSADHKQRLANNVNTDTNNLSEMFLEKCMEISDCVSLVLNKTILSTEEFNKTRDLLRKVRIDTIIDFGRNGFTGVSIETICLIIHPNQKPKDTTVVSMKFNRVDTKKQDYLTDERYPYFIIYRDEDFDKVAEKLEFGVFDVFRDRQITKSKTSEDAAENKLWVIKARNIDDDGKKISHIEGYDVYIDGKDAQKMGVYQYVNDNEVYLTPNMTYNPRVIENVENVIPDGSVAVLIPKKPLRLTEKQRAYFSTKEYRRFYGIARNLSTQSINVDKTSVFFYGVLKNDA